jgi:hypothetical protein
LSNDQAADLVERGASSRLRHLILAHLSGDNNRPDKAWEAAERALHRSGHRHVQVQVARQDEPLHPVAVSMPSQPTTRSRPRAPRYPRAPVDLVTDRQGSLFAK